MWFVVVAKDTFPLPSIDTEPVTEPVRVRVRAVAHLEAEATLSTVLANVYQSDVPFGFVKRILGLYEFMPNLSSVV